MSTIKSKRAEQNGVAVRPSAWLEALVATWRTRAKNIRTLRHPRHPLHADDEMMARGMEACARELEDTLKYNSASTPELSEGGTLRQRIQLRREPAVRCTDWLGSL